MNNLVKVQVLIMLIVFGGLSPVSPVWGLEVNFSGTDAGQLNEEFFYPDWNSISFSHFGVMEDSGSLDLSSYATGIGYDPSRTWNAGDLITDVLLLADFGQISRLPSWSLSMVMDNNLAGITTDLYRLSDFVLAGQQNLEYLIKIVPNLGNFSLKNVSPIYDLVAGQYLSLFGQNAGKVINYLKDKSLNQVLNIWKQGLPVDPKTGIAPLLGINQSLLNLGSHTLNELDLSQYDLNSIPNLDSVAFGQLVGWQKSPLSAIPGLNTVPIANFLTGLNKLGFLARVDVAYGEKEARRINTITGSYEEGFAVPCNQSNCAHLELTDIIDGLRIVHGKQWISGKSQQVRGGWGFLKWVNGGKEPTGRHPFGDAFKVVLTNVDESTGTGKFGIYFRACIDTPLVKGCTPYFIGPVPWFNQKEKSVIFIGFDQDLNNGEGLSNEQIQELLKLYPELPVPPGIPDFLEDIISKNKDTQYSGEGNCQTYKGVHIGSLKEAFSFFESTNDYSAVGKYHPCVGCIPPRYGHALGKYQISSYREDLEAIIKSKSGGVQFWNDLSSGKYAQAKHLVKSQVLTFFSIEEQENLVNTVLKDLIDKYYAKGLRGDKLLTAVASEYSYQASYTRKLAAKYKEKLASAQQKCSQTSNPDENPQPITSCQGIIDLIKPTTGIKTSGFGWRWQRMHNGVDVANAVGTSIRGVAKGKVIDTVSSCHPTHGYKGNPCGGGFGNRVYIKHCNGWVTRYAHLSILNVKKNQIVEQGTIIGAMGNSGSTTKPHLHFEIRVNNGITAVDPEKYISF